MRKLGWSLAIVLLLLQPVAAIYLFTSRPSPSSLAATASLATGYVLFVGRLIYTHSERIYLFVQKGRFYVLGKDVSWGARAEYRGVAVDRAGVADVATRLAQLDHAGQRLAGEALRIVVMVHGATVVVEGHLDAATDDGPVSSGTVVVELLKSNWAFRRALHMSGEIAPALFEEARRLLSPSQEVYSSTISFADDNPYFGLLIRHLQMHTVNRFDVELRVRVDGDHRPATVLARQQEIQITAAKASTLRTVSRQYLALSGG